MQCKSGGQSCLLLMSANRPFHLKVLWTTSQLYCIVDYSQST